MSHCGNPECSCSTGIHEGLTFGSGRLSFNGYWEFPCRICAKYHDDHVEDMINEQRQKLIDAGNFPLVVAVAINEFRNMNFIKIPAFPYEDTDLEKEHKEIKAIVEREKQDWREFDEMIQDW